MDDAVIPPVRAGTIDEELSFEYNHGDYGKGGFTADGVLAWQFDLGAYADYTGMDIGGEYPYVAQANGHQLRVVTEYTWMYSTYSESYSLGVEQIAYRGTTTRDDVFWTMGCDYSMDESLTVEGVRQEQQRYRIRESDDEIDHKAPPRDVMGMAFDSGEAFVRALHSGRVGPTVEEQLEACLRRDSPDGATPASTYAAAETDSTSEAKAD